MPDVVADLDPQADASASSDDRFKNDKSVDTAEAPTKPVEVETKAEAVVEEPESEAESSPAEVEVLEEKADSEPEVPASVQDRINEVIESRRKTEELLSAAELENQQLRERVLDIPVAVEPFKTLADFEFNEGEYQSYMASEMNSRSTAAAEKAVSDAQHKASLARIDTEFNVREKAFAKTVKDYDEVVGNRNLHISDPMAAMIKASEDGPQMYYILASKPENARRIASLPAWAVGVEMGKIQSSLLTERAKAAEPKVTKAPPPVPTIKSGDAGMTKSPADMTDREFRKWREKQIANR